MDIEIYICYIILCIIFFVGIIFVTFFDTLSIIMKLVPVKKHRGYEMHTRVMQSDEYKSHRKKWWKRFLIPIIPFAIILAPAMLVLDDMIAFFIAGIVSAIVFEIISKTEKAERQEVEKCVMLRERNNEQIENRPYKQDGAIEAQDQDIHRK